MKVAFWKLGTFFFSQRKEAGKQSIKDSEIRLKEIDKREEN